MTPEELFSREHRALLPFGEVNFWKGNVAAVGKEDWDRCDIVIRGSHGPIKTFMIGDDTQGTRDMTRHRILSFVWSLNLVFELGKRAKVQEFRTFIGIDKW